MTRRHPNVVNVDEVESKPIQNGRFAAEDRWLAANTGAKQIGCSHYEVEPGKTAFPFHYHCANEEALFILAGTGSLRIGGERVDVRAGDYIAFPVGPDASHQLIATGTTTLKYLALSTMHTTEVVGYPDSKKLAASAAPSKEAAYAGKHWVRHIWNEGPSAKYYDGEDAGS